MNGTRWVLVMGVVCFLFTLNRAHAAPNSMEGKLRGPAPSPVNFGLDLQYVFPTYPNYFWTGTKKISDTGQGVRIALEWLPVTSVGVLGVGLSFGANFFTNVELEPGKFASMYAYPLGGAISYRLAFVRNQLIVPFIRGGVSTVFVNQTSKTGMGKAGVQRFMGSEWAAGAEFSLNAIEPRTAADLDQSVGINETYLVFEYVRSQSLGNSNLIDLSHQEYRLGLRFEM